MIDSKAQLTIDIIANKSLASHVAKHFKNLHDSLKRTLSIGKERGIER